MALVRAFRPPDTTSDGGPLVVMNPREKGLDIDLVPQPGTPAFAKKRKLPPSTQRNKTQPGCGFHADGGGVLGSWITGVAAASPSKLGLIGFLCLQCTPSTPCRARG